MRSITWTLSGCAAVSRVHTPESRQVIKHLAQLYTYGGLGSILADEEVHMAFLPAHWSSAINHAAPSPHTSLSPFQRWNSTTFTFQGPSSIWIFVCSQSGDQFFFPSPASCKCGYTTQSQLSIVDIFLFFSAGAASSNFNFEKWLC
jgi:hypothetical protein